MNTKKNKKIIALVGMPGAGKSSVIEMFVSQYVISHIYFGNFTLQEVKRRGLPETQANEKKIRQALRKEYGMGAYARLALPEIERILAIEEMLLIDGLYSWSEYTLLKERRIGQIILLPVISMRENRYRRLAIRPIRPLSYEEAEERDFSEIENLEKGGPIALCDYYITNDGSLEELAEKVRKFAKEMGFERK